MSCSRTVHSTTGPETTKLSYFGANHFRTVLTFGFAGRHLSRARMRVRTQHSRKTNYVIGQEISNSLSARAEQYSTRRSGLAAWATVYGVIGVVMIFF